MDTRFLESLVAVAELGSMAAAARQLGVTPAALAQRIRALEAELGVLLITRAGRTVVPTEAGIAIVERGREVLRGVQEMRGLAAGDDLAGEFRLGAISTALTGFLPGGLKRFIRAAPRVDLYVVPGTSVELYRKVGDDELDAAVVIHPQFVLPKACNWHLLREEPLVLLIPKGLSGRDPHDLLRTEPFIRYDRNHWGGRLADLYLRRAGIRPQERLELDALDAIAVMVSEGLGISLVPDWAPPWPEGISVEKIALPDPGPSRQVGVLWMRSSKRDRLVRALIESLGEPKGAAVQTRPAAELVPAER